jgi:hypothetical protein
LKCKKIFKKLKKITRHIVGFLRISFDEGISLTWDDDEDG